MRLCYVCLAPGSDCRLFNMESHHLLEAYRWLSGANSVLSEDALICSQCATLLKKCVNLRNMCRSSHELLLQCMQVTDEKFLIDDRFKTDLTNLKPANKETLFYEEVKENENFKYISKEINTESCKFYKLTISCIDEMNSTDEETVIKTEIKAEIYSNSDDFFSDPDKKIDAKAGNLQIMVENKQEVIKAEFLKNNYTKSKSCISQSNSKFEILKTKLQQGNVTLKKETESQKKLEVSKQILKPHCLHLKEFNDSQEKIALLSLLTQLCNDSKISIPESNLKTDSSQSKSKQNKTHTYQNTYTCNKCHKIFKTKHLLTYHLRRNHCEKIGLLCQYCSYQADNNGNLINHERIHTGEKPFKCDVCFKLFSQKGTLERHKLIHTGERPYNCDICTQAFRQKDTLKAHMRTHTGERPFNCHMCTKAFSQSQSLKNHINTHTGMKPYSCSICDKSFAERSTLCKHIKTHKATS